MQVVKLARYRNRELVDVLKGLLELAEDGTAQGLGFVVKLGRGNHRTALVGDYSRNPDEAMMAVIRLKDRLVEDSEFDEDSEIRDM